MRLAFLGGLSASVIGAGGALSMRVSPLVAIAPSDLWVRVHVEADKANRALEIIAESPDFYRSSEIPLDGEHAALTSVCEFRSLPAGLYAITAILKGQGGRALATSESSVLLAGGVTTGR
jgi:hypothetical protein